MSKKITILGAGSAGCRILQTVRNMPGAENIDLIAFDSDAEALASSGLPPEKCLLAGKQWRNGKGCGGNINDGKSAASAERENLSAILKGSDLIIVLAGLGRGFATGAMSVLQSVTSTLKIPTVFLVTTPFVFEGPTRRGLAEKTIDQDLRPLAGAVVTIPNDLLFSAGLDANASYEEAFAAAEQQMAAAALSLAMTLVSGNRMPADFASLSALLDRKRSICSIAFGEADADDPDKCRKVVESLLDSPLLGGSSKLRQADAVMAMLNGGEFLSIGDAREVLENMGKYIRSDAEMLSGITADPAWGKSMKLTVITIKFDDISPEIPVRENLHAAAGKRSKKRVADSGDEFQPDLFSENDPGTGVMDRTSPVIIDNVNYDVPTFKRQNIFIDAGSSK